MSRRSKCRQLPTEIREELNRRLIENGFSNYRQLEKWLDDKGFNISSVSVWRYGKEFEEKLQKIEFLTSQAKAICEVSGDDENNMGEALTKLAQQKAFEQLLKIDLNSEDVKFVTLVRAISDLNRSSVSLKKYRREIREKLEEATEDIAKNNGLSEELAQQIKAKILGIV
jgi:hypothetical protein